MQVIVNALLTRYEVQGKGKVVLLLHGWGDSATGMQDLSASLGKRYAVVSLDLPGFGNSQSPHGAWGLDAYAEFIQVFLHKIGRSDLWAIVGHSNGGAIAVRGLAAGYLRSERLVLMASAGIRGVDKGRVRALRVVAKTGKLFVKPLPKATQAKLRKKFYTDIGSDMLVAEHLQATFKRIVRDDVRADAAQLTLPTLLLYGDNDTQTPLWYGEAYHELIADSTLEVLGGAGHFVHIDRPREVVKAIEGFLK
jgi:pimeloyl-ACP methyl ester carboxylesterase